MRALLIYSKSSALRIIGFLSRCLAGGRLSDSARPDQSTLPTLARSEFVAENVATHDGSLSAWA